MSARHLSRASLSVGLTLLALAVLQARVGAQTANFDGATEGFVGITYEENGIVLSEVDTYLGSTNPGIFAVEEGTGVLAHLPGFSPPNVLGFNGYAPGPNVGYARCGAFTITPPAPADHGSVHMTVRGFGLQSGNVISLEASLAGTVVATDSTALPQYMGPHSLTLVVSGVTFDQLRVVGSGPNNGGAFYGHVDGVHFGSVYGSSYCTSTANTTGSRALITVAGSNSVAASDLVLRAHPVPHQFGVFLYGPDQVALPFGPGTLCVGGIARLPIATPYGLQIAHRLDVTQPPDVAHLVTPGSVWNFQAWFRDPAAGAPYFNLSDGIEVSFVP